MLYLKVIDPEDYSHYVVGIGNVYGIHLPESEVHLGYEIGDPENHEAPFAVLTSGENDEEQPLWSNCDYYILNESGEVFEDLNRFKSGLIEFP